MFFRNQLDIKLRQFMQEKYDIVLRKNKNKKVACLDEVPTGLEKKEIWGHTSPILQRCI